MQIKCLNLRKIKRAKRRKKKCRLTRLEQQKTYQLMRWLQLWTTPTPLKPMRRLVHLKILLIQHLEISANQLKTYQLLVLVRWSAKAFKFLGHSLQVPQVMLLLLKGVISKHHSFEKLKSQISSEMTLQCKMEMQRRSVHQSGELIFLTFLWNSRL